MAIRANLDLRLAEARIRQARASLGVAGGAFYPEVNATALYERSHSSSQPFPSRRRVAIAGHRRSGGGSSQGFAVARRFRNYFRWVWMPPGK